MPLSMQLEDIDAEDFGYPTSEAPSLTDYGQTSSLPYHTFDGGFDFHQLAAN